MNSIYLIKSIGYPKNGELSFSKPIESQELYKIARINKIGSLYLKSLYENDLINELWQEYQERLEFQHKLRDTYENIIDYFPNTIEYIIVKTVHPFWSDSSDVDILVNCRLNYLIDVLQSYEYEISGKAPTALSVKDPETGLLIDIQKDFGLFKVKYHDKQTIGYEYRETKGVKIPVTTYTSDISLQIDHSLTELIFILKEYYSSLFYLEQSGEKEIDNLLGLIQNNKSERGAVAFFTIVKNLSEKTFGITPKHSGYLLDSLGRSSIITNSLEASSYQFPFRYPKSTLIKYTLRKFHQRKFRNSFIKQTPYMLNPRILYYLMNKVYDRGTRQTY